ncbi:MAG: hypothetical protein K2L51_00895 [Clostridiales bacterium]|nr:hypothetical protein [Clostridiales bacterium]
MAKFLGKVIGEFVCAHISQLNSYCLDGEDRLKDTTCVDDAELMDYVGFLDKTFYLWHISDLKIYEKPKELSKFNAVCPKPNRSCWADCMKCKYMCINEADGNPDCDSSITRPPQSWMYVEEMRV